MDYRRYYGLRAPRPLGCSTFMVPQLENYTLFATPYMDLNKKIGKLIQEFQQDLKSQSETVIKSKENVKPTEEMKSEDEEMESEEKKLEDEPMLSEETSKVDIKFGIVLNIATVKPEDLTITLGEGNEIEVNVNQSDVKLGRMDITFSRNCSYKYQLPEDINKKYLVALRTSDHYLIILPLEALRHDVFIKSVKAARSSDTDDAIPMEITESTDVEESEPKERSDSKESESKGSKSKDSESKGSEPKEKKEEGKTRKRSKLDADEAIAREVEEVTKAEDFVKDNRMSPVDVCRELRPGLDILLLRKYMVDLESYVSTARKFVENASFITQNSKTPEIRLRALALKETDQYLEKSNKESEDKDKEKKAKKISKEPSGESGYTSSDKSDASPLDASDESSRGSSTKSEEPAQDKPGE